METQVTNTKMSAIDRALAAAKARKAAKESGETSVSDTLPTVTVTEEDLKSDLGREALKAARAAEKQVKLAKLEEERIARRAARAAKKAAREAASAKPAHMKKVERAASKLPNLSSEAQVTFSDITSNFSGEQITALALHLQHHQRVTATTRAVNTKLAVGQSVRIVGGDPKHLGKTGTVDRVQRIRCYVAVAGMEKPLYCFTSDVSVVVDQDTAAVAAG